MIALAPNGSADGHEGAECATALNHYFCYRGDQLTTAQSHAVKEKIMVVSLALFAHLRLILP